MIDFPLEVIEEIDEVINYGFVAGLSDENEDDDFELDDDEDDENEENEEERLFE
jgi:hypothetical protein